MESSSGAVVVDAPRAPGYTRADSPLPQIAESLRANPALEIPFRSHKCVMPNPSQRRAGVATPSTTARQCRLRGGNRGVVKIEALGCPKTHGNPCCFPKPSGQPLAAQYPVPCQCRRPAAVNTDMVKPGQRPGGNHRFSPNHSECGPVLHQLANSRAGLCPRQPDHLTYVWV